MNTLLFYFTNCPFELKIFADGFISFGLIMFGQGASGTRCTFTPTLTVHSHPHPQYDATTHAHITCKHTCSHTHAHRYAYMHKPNTGDQTHNVIICISMHVCTCTNAFQQTHTQIHDDTLLQCNAIFTQENPPIDGIGH